MAYVYSSAEPELQGCKFKPGIHLRRTDPKLCVLGQQQKGQHKSVGSRLVQAGQPKFKYVQYASCSALGVQRSAGSITGSGHDCLPAFSLTGLPQEITAPWHPL